MRQLKVMGYIMATSYILRVYNPIVVSVTGVKARPHYLWIPVYQLKAHYCVHFSKGTKLGLNSTLFNRYKTRFKLQKQSHAIQQYRTVASHLTLKLMVHPVRLLNCKPLIISIASSLVPDALLPLDSSFLSSYSTIAPFIY